MTEKQLWKLIFIIEYSKFNCNVVVCNKVINVEPFHHLHIVSKFSASFFKLKIPIKIHKYFQQEAFDVLSGNCIKIEMT